MEYSRIPRKAQLAFAILASALFAPLATADEGRDPASCISEVADLLDSGLSSEVALQIADLAETPGCTAGDEEFQRQFRLFADVTMALATNDATYVAPYADDSSLVDRAMALASTSCPSTVQAGSVGISLIANNQKFTINEQVAAGTASRAGGAVDTNHAHLTVAGTQAYGLKVADGALYTQPTIYVAGVPIPAQTGGASVSCGVAVDTPIKDLVKQACTAQAQAKLLGPIPIIRDYVKGDPLNVVVWGDSASAIPCDD